MARGRFGRRRRSSGNLTALIAQLYREQRAAEDRVMFDAYQNGGKVDGKPVTDQRIRAYIAGRRDGFSKDDPLYDEWNNRLIQIDFRIGEDKVQLAFQQGKVGAGAVASFYRQQLRNIPQDSAFYREVAGRAADWAKSAAAAARGAARSRLNTALEAKWDGAQATADNYVQITAILTQAAQRAGLIAGNQTLTDADATDLEAFLKRGVPGPKGATITFDDWRRASVAAYKTYDVKLGIAKQLNRGTKELRAEKQRFLDRVLVRINTIDDRAKYEVAYDGFQEAAQDAGNNPRAILEAAQAYAATLGAIKATAEKSGNADPEFIGGLTNEINILTTGKPSGYTVADLQSTSTEGLRYSDGDETAANIARALSEAEALDTGAAFYGQEEFGGAFAVQYYPPGAKYDPFGRNGLDASQQEAIIDIGGKPTKVVLKGQPVFATGLIQTASAVSPRTVAMTGDRKLQNYGVAVGDSVVIDGKTVPVANLTSSQILRLLANGYVPASDPATQTPIGYVFTDPASKQTQYGVIQPDGSMVFTNTNPFGNSLLPSKSGLQMFTGSMPDPLAPASKPRLIPTPPQIQATNPSSILADESITAQQLLALAKSASSTEALRYAALAEERARNVAAEKAYMERGRQGNPSDRSLAGYLSQRGQDLAALGDMIRETGGLASAPKEYASAYAPPPLNPIGSRSSFALPPAPSVMPSSPQPAPVPADVYNPPPAPPAPNYGAPGAYYEPPLPEPDSTIQTTKKQKSGNIAL